MRNRDMPAAPQDENQYGGPAYIFCGLTKRETAAIAAMQSALATLGADYSYAERAQVAAKQADALFDELEKGDGDEQE